MKKILYFAGIALLAASCTDDYTDWAGLQRNAAEEAKTVNVSITPVAGNIDLAAAGDSVKLFTPTVAVDDEADCYYVVDCGTGEEGIETINLQADDEGRVLKSELQDVVVGFFGARPEARTLSIDVTSYTLIKGQSIKKALGQTTVSVVPEAPEIETAYYLTGSINNWDPKDTTYKMTNDGSDPYDNPVFKLRIPAPEDGSNVEFKMTPESGIGGDWSKCLGAGEEGKFLYNNAGGNFIITADPDALFYDIVFNMLDQTWSATPVGFNEFIYEIGNESGWSEPHALYGNGTGQYSAVIRLDGEFKFKPNKDDWNGDWEKVSGNATGGTLSPDGSSNMDGVADGFYLVQVDLKEMTYKLTPITSISIIGSVRGAWDTDVEMTYNENLKCWEARETLNAGEFKFRANHDWAINWGGAFDQLAQDGANLQLAADGPYVIRLYLSGEAAHHCTVKEDNGYPDFFYEIGNEGSWGTSHALAGNGNGQYQGYYYLDGEFKFKPNADNWDNDLEYVDGNATSGSLTDGGGPNCPDPGAGFYQINLNLDAMSYSLLKIESVSMIGGFNDWGGDLEMAYNVADGCWEVTTDAVSGEYKFRANHDWGINWGGSEGDLTPDGANLNIAAGTYKFQLYLSFTGNNKVVITKQ
ncbi:MAG: DUF5115 domain-containing protein [Prevotella sp.]|nr:DUF5115 domain-containing protein [Prevotella sp.]